jgi:electron transfer flavoprotein alpha subunit
MSGIWVVIEDRDGRVSRISWEAVAAGQKLAALTSQPANAIVLGAKTETLASEVAAKALAKVVRIEHPLLAAYTADGFTLALQQFFAAEKPDYVVFPHTYQVRDYAPKLAARLGQALIGDVTAIGAEVASPDRPLFTRQLLQGRLNGSYRHTGNGPCFVSVQAGALRPEDVIAQAQPGSSAVSLFSPSIEPSQICTRPSERFRDAAQTVDLSSAQLIVGVGRGIKDAANLPLVQELATALGAELGASRPICDNGWLAMERQIGSSGQTIAPRLYLALGISGAIQHLVGIKGSQCVVAVNKDPGAPIFEAADYGIAGDLMEVVPALTEAVKAARQ